MLIFEAEQPLFLYIISDDSHMKDEFNWFWAEKIMNKEERKKGLERKKEKRKKQRLIKKEANRKKERKERKERKNS